MRIITAIGFANETAYQTYSANGFTLAQNDPGSIGGIIISYSIPKLLCYLFDMINRALTFDPIMQQ